MRPRARERRRPDGMKPSRLLLLLLVMVSGAGCDSLLGSDAVTTISITNGARLELPWGESAALSVRDGGGNAVRSSRLTWSTDDPGVASVSDDGVVSARGFGETRVRARLADSGASIRIAVVMQGAEDVMRIQVSGAVEEEFVVRPGPGYSLAVGLEAEFLERPDWAFAYLLGETYSVPLETEGGVVLAMPGGLDAGSYRLTPASLDDLASSRLVDLGGPIAYLYRTTQDYTLHLYPARSGTVEITAVDELDISFARASVRGTAEFVADEYRATYDEATGRHALGPTGRSTRVEVDFHIPAGLYYGGFMDVTASGGTYATDEQIEGWADGNHDPTHGARLELFGGDAGGGEISLRLEVAEPAVGTALVGTGIQARWHQVTSDGSRIEARGEDGSLTLTELAPATATDWGVARGSLDITFRVSGQSDAAAGQGMTVTGTFAVPLAPGSDGPSS